MKIYNGNCIEIMKNIPEKSIDMILCDLPYGTTECKWDTIIPFENVWQEYKRIIKDGGTIALFGSEPFSSKLRMSNISMYKYDWFWDKQIPSGMGLAKYQPMRQIENISIFSKGKTKYYPQMIKRDKPIKSGGTKYSPSAPVLTRIDNKNFSRTYEYKNPISLLSFPKVRKGSIHPTQKPVALLEYLIKTYTLEGETVLDNCMGSGSTGVACLNTNRKFIGIEIDKEYFEIAKNRLNGVINENSKS